MKTTRTWTTAECRPSDALCVSIFVRDDHTCQYCGKVSGADSTVDHVMPASWFSRRTPKSTVNHPTNIVTACERCNSALKGGLSLNAFAEKLLNMGVRAAKVSAMVARVNAARLRPVVNI